MQKTQISTKWHLQVIRGHVFHNHWKAAKALHVAV